MTDSLAAVFVADVLKAARAAEATNVVTIQRLEIAGVRIDLHYAGSALHTLFGPALAHLEVEHGATAATVIRLWDTVSTGVSAPPPPVPRDRFTDRGDLVGLDDLAHRAAFHWSEYSVCVFDLDLAEGAYWVADPAKLPYWSRSSPLRTILGWVLAVHGRQLIHAAAVATDDGAVLIAGSGGSGKSTTALTALEAGLDFLGDDYVAVSLDPPTVHSVYATAKIADAAHPAARRLPMMASSPGDEKFVLSLYPTTAAQLPRSAPLRAIVTPEIGDGEESQVVEVERDRLEHAATFTTLAQLPYAGSDARARIEGILDEVPGGLLRLGRDRAGVVQVIRRLAADPVVSPDSAARGLPSVTVVIPVRNGAQFLSDSVASVLAQRYPHLEIVIVDDGSDDDLSSAIAALPVDVRVHHQATAGPAAARNTGLALASGELVAFLDVDDRWPPGSLLTLVRERMSVGAAVVVGRAQVVELNLETGDEVPIGTPDTAYPHYISSALFERAVFDRVGLFDAGMMFAEDTDWFARLDESDERVRRLSAVTLIVRRHGQNMTDGRDLVELHVVRAVKNALDRKRIRDGLT